MPIRGLTELLAKIRYIVSKWQIRDPIERETILTIRELIRDAQPYVLFSGGRDSLVALDLVRRACRLAGKEAIAIHADTTIGLPGSLRYVRQICRSLKVRLIVTQPEVTFFKLAKRKGFPRFDARWCCYELKVNPIRNVLRKEVGNKIVFDGVRAEESRQRSSLAQLSLHKRFKCWVFHPILYWKKQHVLAYLERHHLPVNPLYAKGFKRATECWCGVFKTVDEFKLLRKRYPGFFKKLVQLEASMRRGGSYLYKQGRRIYLRDLR